MSRLHLRALISVALAGLAALVLAIVTPGQANAHERRAIANNQAEAVVGWLVEPTFTGEPNGVDFRVTNPTTKEPIEGLEKSLKVEVTQGATKRTYDLRTRFGMKGAYTADIMPTVAGDYAFRFFGEVNGTKVDEKFESGPGRFDAPKSPASIQFPTVEPTSAQLAAQVTAANAAADSARTLGVIGIVVGILGLAAAAAAFFMRRPGGRAAASAAD